MKTICAAGPLVKGIDIYHGDYIDDINQVIGSGVGYIYNKAWEYKEDQSFHSRWAALDGKVIRGAYDFFHPGRDPIAQAKAFLATFGGVLKPNDLPCALDFEVSDGVGSQDLRNRALTWLEHVEQVTKVRPVLYMSPGFVTLDSRFAKYGIWIANYGVNCPHLPDALSAWQFWQTTGTGRVPGMRGQCDMDVFNGDMSILRAFIKNSRVA